MGTNPNDALKRRATIDREIGALRRQDVAKVDALMRRKAEIDAEIHTLIQQHHAKIDELTRQGRQAEVGALQQQFNAKLAAGEQDDKVFKWHAEADHESEGWWGRKRRELFELFENIVK